MSKITAIFLKALRKFKIVDRFC